jgi:hypothetical protein
MRKFLLIAAPVVIIILTGLFLWNYYFVFGEGVKAGNLNFLVKKGYVFKTWEGRLIQEGFKTPTPGAMQSNEFEFTVVNDSIAEILERSSGKFVEVRYKEYLHSPNPSSGNINIYADRVNSAASLELQITNLLGEIVYIESLENVNGVISTNLQLAEGLSNGAYLMNLLIDGKAYSKSFILNR